MNQSGGEKELREQLLQEIENKAKSCSNPTFECSLPRLEGYEFCLRHILRDVNSPYRQCAYLYPNSRKCPNAVLKHDIKKDPALTMLCFEHNRQVQLSKTHTSIGKLLRAETNDSLLHGLSHHLNFDKITKEPEVATEPDEEEIDVVSPHVSAFVLSEQVQDMSKINADMKNQRRILDYASDSSAEDEDPPRMENTARCFEYDESDDDSVASLEDEDLLKHAGIYTREEVAKTTENKLTRLQSLYLRQLSHLQTEMKNSRRKYMIATRGEKEVLSSIHNQLKDSPQERKHYENFKALSTYHRHRGQDAVLRKKFKEKRQRITDGLNYKPVAMPKCVFAEGGVKCTTAALPSCKYCRKHILEDKKQVLFRACNVEKGGVRCMDPIPCIFDDSTCPLHLPAPIQRQYAQKKYESETEDDDAETRKYKEE
ncbi:KAT8 regulatory NSL complex subunit 2-like [Teleopsis dalmanni]|uniref:KAT8 regulatory NSL complex subunit 2-like n=1 Tax=Teleopsis dalmanni TaxID=139649 RepID=UPI0018CF64CF|nr:KAT8 regulatory NSL complex subunit 2-like [Teleopsis dalmanni]